jgi:hypothetical protein
MIIMPAIMTGQFLAVRRARMPQELMLPLTRRQYVDGLLVAVARSSLVVWLTVHAALLGLLWVISRATLTGPFVLALTALALATQIYAFGAMTRTAQILAGTKRMIVMMLALMPAMFAVSVGLDSLGDPGLTRDEALRRARESATTTVDMPAEYREHLEERLQRQATRMWDRERPRPKRLWIATGLMAVAGGALTLHSRRRWLELELG